MKHLFIVNPTAGGKDKTELVRRRAEEVFAGREEAYEVYVTKAAMDWKNLDGAVWEQERALARSKEFNGNYNIVGADIDPHALELAKENARRAGVLDIIRFEQADAMAFDRRTERGIIVTNPPYGERIMEKQEAEARYRGVGRAYAQSRDWQLYLLSSHTEFERCFGRPADKKRKLYNGMIKCDLFMYLNKGDGKK